MAATEIKTVSRCRPRVVQNFLLVWLDANIDEAKEDFKNSLTHLRHIIASISTFTDADECIQFINETKDERVFMIVSGSLGQRVVSNIHEWPQVNRIYVFCNDKEFHEKWAKTMPKVEGVFTRIELICSALLLDCQRCDQAMISISFQDVDPLFMYTQLFKEVLLEINDDDDDDDKALHEFVEYCRSQNDISEDEILLIEQNYRLHTPIWWYTAPLFLYSMLNRGLRLLDVDILLKMGFFIRQLHRHIDQLHYEQQHQRQALAKSIPFKVFRGQGLFLEDFEKLKRTKGGFLSFNNFLSTSRKRDISLRKFSRPAAFMPHSVGILFVMTIDPDRCAESYVRFVEVNKHVGYFEDREAEILFSTHTMFSVENIEPMLDDYTDRIWQVTLNLVGNQNHQLNKTMSYMRDELNSVKKGWPQLGRILIKLGQSQKAVQVYEVLLENVRSESDRAYYHQQLGMAYNNIGDYNKAFVSYQKALDIRREILPSNHRDLANSYNSIGLVYSSMGEYSKALSFYEQSLEIKRKTLAEDHLDLVDSYSNVGDIQMKTGALSKALSYYEKARDIQVKSLPEKHPDLAATYMNIGLVYSHMAEYKKALLCYEQSLDIKIKSLPPNHPNLANSYNNIGNVYTNMGEYSKALEYYEKTLLIQERILPKNHPDLATTHMNIGLLNSKIGKYAIALASHEKALDIKTTSLPRNHPDLATSYNNIGLVYDTIGEYSKALSYYEQSLDIKKKTLTPHNPKLASSYNNMGSVYYKMGEYSKTLLFYEESLKIKQQTLPENHPDLAHSYWGIGLANEKMNQYSQALSFLQRALDIFKNSFPSNHPDIVSVEANIGRIKKKLSAS